ncbi:hypothetical protein [Spirosoma radiotolerans]|uniref:Molybdopterin oxidoreductase n=1 Tax=Spirosoma radiotolerans TaxID=1379870 RepID=A0A0E3V7B0_9BACT|nr:hypothetical protein [Spirosoma radiotolerans]AKD55261.1 molybdopterin oxidoreductase [Spirosoma radiotolerans]
MHIGNYLSLVQQSEQQLSRAFSQVADHHGDEPDIYQVCQTLSDWSRQHTTELQPLVDRYRSDKSDEPERLSQTLFDKPRTGGLALLRDLHDLYLLATEVELCWVVLLQAARGLRDQELESRCETFDKTTKRQLTWLMTRIKQAAPQTLIVAD